MPTADLKYDMLKIEVLEASNMVLKEKVGTEGLVVEVVLISSDYQTHMSSEKRFSRHSV